MYIKDKIIWSTGRRTWQHLVNGSQSVSETSHSGSKCRKRGHENKNFFFFHKTQGLDVFGVADYESDIIFLNKQNGGLNMAEKIENMNKN
jgi:hypothetical protein